jgi:hypothetical protein
MHEREETERARHLANFTAMVIEALHESFARVFGPAKDDLGATADFVEERAAFERKVFLRRIGDGEERAVGADG